MRCDLRAKESIDRRANLSSGGNDGVNTKRHATKHLVVELEDLAGKSESALFILI